MNPYEAIENKIAGARDLGELEESLHALLSGGYAVWEDGSLYSIKQLIETQNGLKISIYPNEHPPPHFHVKSGDINASFSIEMCELLEGKLGRSQKALIEWWHKSSKDQLIKIWNDTRPSDCPVGQIVKKH